MAGSGALIVIADETLNFREPLFELIYHEK